MNFIPDFVQILSSVSNPQYEKMDMKNRFEEILDEVETRSKKKKKTDLNNYWVNYTDWISKQVPILVLSKGRPEYKYPKTISSYPKYKGPLLEIQANTFVYLKPSTQVKSNNQDIKGKDLTPNSKLDFFVGEQIIQKIEQISWEGNLFSLSFDSPVYLPIRYDGEYILIPC